MPGRAALARTRRRTPARQPAGDASRHACRGAPRDLPLAGAGLAGDHAREVEPQDLAPGLGDVVVGEDPGRLGHQDPWRLGNLGGNRHRRGPRHGRGLGHGRGLAPRPRLAGIRRARPAGGGPDRDRDGGNVLATPAGHDLHRGGRPGGSSRRTASRARSSLEPSTATSSSFSASRSASGSSAASSPSRARSRAPRTAPPRDHRPAPRRRPPTPRPSAVRPYCRLRRTWRRVTRSTSGRSPISGDQRVARRGRWPGGGRGADVGRDPPAPRAGGQRPRRRAGAGP